MAEWTGEKFPIGTRVRVYATLNSAVAETAGVVTRLRTADGMLYVNLDGRRGEIVAHPMQCRRLIKKQRMRLWVAITQKGAAVDVVVGGSMPMMLPPCSNQDMPSWHEFIEVKKPNASA